MIRTPSILNLVVSGLSLAVLSTGATAQVQTKIPETIGHDHLTKVGCVEGTPGVKRPEFGCFNVGTARELQFQEPTVFWHLTTFGDRRAADAVESAFGIVVEQDGRVWLSKFAARDATPRGGKVIAAIGPLRFRKAQSYSAVLSYAVMRPGDSSRVHTHPGLGGWHVIA